MSRKSFPCPKCRKLQENLVFDGEYKCGNGHVIAREERDALLFLMKGSNAYLKQLNEHSRSSRKLKGSFEFNPYPKKRVVVPPPVPEECVVLGKPFQHMDEAIAEALALKGKDSEGIYGTIYEAKSFGYVVIKCSSVPANGYKTDNGLIMISPRDDEGD